MLNFNTSYKIGLLFSVYRNRVRKVAVKTGTKLTSRPHMQHYSVFPFYGAYNVAACGRLGVYSSLPGLREVRRLVVSFVPDCWCEFSPPDNCVLRRSAFGGCTATRHGKTVLSVYCVLSGMPV